MPSFRISIRLVGGIDVAVAADEGALALEDVEREERRLSVVGTGQAWSIPKMHSIVAWLHLVVYGFVLPHLVT